MAPSHFSLKSCFVPVGPPPRNQIVAFTLIELLVVISIIALMIAILLPALRAARATTQQAICAANLKQIVLAQTLYADEFDGAIVGSGWFQRIRPYIGDPSYTYFRNEVLVCPADSTQGGEGAVSSATGLVYFNHESKRRSYGVNGRISATASPTTLHEMKQPSSTLWYGDSEWWDYNASQIWDTVFYLDLLMPEERHRGIENLAFLDGHADTSITIDSLYPGEENHTLWYDHK